MNKITHCQRGCWGSLAGLAAAAAATLIVLGVLNRLRPLIAYTSSGGAMTLSLGFLALACRKSRHLEPTTGIAAEPEVILRPPPTQNQGHQPPGEADGELLVPPLVPGSPLSPPPPTQNQGHQPLGEADGELLVPPLVAGRPLSPPPPTQNQEHQPLEEADGERPLSIPPDGITTDREEPPQSPNGNPDIERASSQNSDSEFQDASDVLPTRSSEVTTEPPPSPPPMRRPKQSKAAVLSATRSFEQFLGMAKTDR